MKESKPKRLNKLKLVNGEWVDKTGYPKRKSGEEDAELAGRFREFYEKNKNMPMVQSHLEMIQADDLRLKAIADEDWKKQRALDAMPEGAEGEHMKLSSLALELASKAISEGIRFVNGDEVNDAVGKRGIDMASDILMIERRIREKRLDVELAKGNMESCPNTWAAPIPSRRLTEAWKPGKKLSEIVEWHYGQETPLFSITKQFNARQRVIFQPHYKQHEIAKAILEGDTNYICCVFSRRFGKSLLLIALADMIAQHPEYWNTNAFGRKPDRANIMITGITHHQLYKIYFEAGLIQSIFGDRNDCSIRIADRSVQYDNGSVISFLGADTKGSREGRGYNFIFVDEAAVTDKLEHFVEHSLKPMLLDWRGKLVLIGSPKSSGSDFEKYALSGDDPGSGWRTLRGTSLENPHNDLATLEDSINSMDEETAACEYMCKFTSAQGSVFRYAGHRNLDPVADLDKKLPLDIVFDFNVQHYSIMFGQVHYDFNGRKKLKIIDCYRPGGTMTTDLAVQWLLNTSKYSPDKFPGRIRLFGDATGRAEKTSSAGYTDWSIIEDTLRKGVVKNGKLYTYSLVSSHVEASNPRGNAFIDSINSVNSLLDPINGSPRLFLNTFHTSPVVRDLEQLQWDESKRRPSKKQEGQGIGHFADCVRYWVFAVEPVSHGASGSSPTDPKPVRGIDDDDGPVLRTGHVID